MALAGSCRSTVLPTLNNIILSLNHGELVTTPNAHMFIVREMTKGHFLVHSMTIHPVDTKAELLD